MKAHSAVAVLSTLVLVYLAGFVHAGEHTVDLADCDAVNGLLDEQTAMSELLEGTVEDLKSAFAKIERFSRESKELSQKILSLANPEPDANLMLADDDDDATSRNEVMVVPANTLIEEAARGNEKAVGSLLEAGADVDFRDGNGSTALHWAAGSGHDRVVMLLLMKGADINARDIYGYTPLYWAASKGRVSAVSALLDMYPDVNAKGWFGYTALHRAAANGYDAIVAILIGKGANINGTISGGWTVMHLAAAQGRTSVIHMLLGYRARLNVLDNKGLTTVHLAAAYGHSDTLVELFQDGASIDAVDHFGSTALHLAALGGHRDAAVTLIEQYGLQLLQTSQIDEIMETIKSTLRYEAEEEEEYGRKMFKAKINAKDRLGRTPLHRAAEAGHVAVVDLLLKVGASMVDNSPFTNVLHVAAANGHALVVERLIDEGASFDEITKEGIPLHTAAAQGHIEVVQLLIRKYEENSAAFFVDQQDLDGFTALHRAATNGRNEVVTALIMAGADTQIRTSHKNGGLTALGLAKKYHHDSTAAILQINPPY